MKFIRSHLILLALSLLGLSRINVHADGGVIRLRETKGSFVITIFTAGDPVLDRAFDLSVLIQGRDTGDPVLDADVRFALSAPQGLATKQSEAFCCSPGVSMHTTREQASNKLLYAAPLLLHEPGNWKLHVLVSRGTHSARVDCLLPVTLGSNKLAGAWPFLALPLLVVILYAMNQGLRR
jgi:hypothetical protein